MGLFLTSIEVRELTGFAYKAKQIEQLRRMGIAFFVNGCGRPIVAVATIEGSKQQAAPPPKWEPAMLMNAGHKDSDGFVRRSNKKAGNTKRKAKTPRP